MQTNNLIEDFEALCFLEKRSGTMEFGAFESLSREEILQTFEQRHLHMTDMYNLTREELVRVYKSFALPLSRRPLRQHKHVAFQIRQRDSCESGLENEQMSPVVNRNTNENMQMEIDSTPVQSHNCDYIQPTSPISIGEKRRPSHEDFEDNYQYHLSRATKRIKINTNF